jgi:hypothetical protein
VAPAQRRNFDARHGGELAVQALRGNGFGVVGDVIVVGRDSEFALYDERFVTFGEDDVYQQSDAAGFIRLYGLSARVRAIRDQEMAAAQNERVAKEEARKPASLAIA